MSQGITFTTPTPSLPTNPKGIIKAKKVLDDVTAGMVTLLTDYYSAYFERHKLAPIEDMKKNGAMVRSQEEYHIPLICILLILTLVNSESGSMQAALLQSVYVQYIDAQVEPYDAVTELLSMFGVQFDDTNVPTIYVKDEAPTEEATV